MLGATHLSDSSGSRTGTRPTDPVSNTLPTVTPSMSDSISPLHTPTLTVSSNLSTVSEATSTLSASTAPLPNTLPITSSSLPNSSLPQHVIATSSNKYEQYRDQLLSVEVPGEFYRSPAYLAVRNIYGPNSREKQLLLEMTVKLLRAKHNRDPTLEEMSDVLFDDDLNKEKIVSAYANVCLTVHNTQQNSSNNVTQPSTRRQQNEEQEQRMPVGQPEAIGREEDRQQPNGAHALRDGQERRQQSTVLQVLRKEHEYLCKKLTCVGCRARPINVVFLPCGHFAMCDGCSMSHNICPMCNKTVLAETKTYLC